MDALPEDLHRQVFTHASWTTRRVDTYQRLAFLGDAVLELAITAHLYPRLAAEDYGEGRLSKIRAQTVCAAACQAVAIRLGVPDELRAVAPAGAAPAETVFTERVLSSITEAIIGACYLEGGYDKVAEAVVEAFQPELEEALTHPVDFKSALQERLAQTQQIVGYELLGREGVEHEPVFQVSARLEPPANGKAAAGGKPRELAKGHGRTKKAAEQDAARRALERLDAAPVKARS